jgi:hypothetical protein
MTTIAPLSHAGSSKPKEWKKRTKLSTIKFCCGHCHTNGADHQYDTCPKWLVCIFCMKTGHLGYVCPNLHYSYNGVSCCVPSNQPDIGDFCPTSQVHCLTAWGQCVKELGECNMGESFYEGIDWDFFHVN